MTSNDKELLKREDVVLQGASICPGIGIGRVHEELRTQLRAMLRAATAGHVGILIPMVTTVEDVVAARDHLVAARKELQAAGAVFAPDISLGAMIETPAAAAAVREILGLVEFISIGTNDLLQYFMAADRDNERVARYNDAASPPFLWLMKHIIDQARQAGREADVTICGEVTSDARVLPHLLRMGYRSFSVSPVSATLVRNVCATIGQKGREVPSKRGKESRKKPNNTETTQPNKLREKA